jgi:hypothetical protein
MFVRRQAIKRTTSGKVARNLTRDKWLADGLRTIETHVREGDGAGLDWAPSLDIEAHYKRFLGTYALTGDEDARPGDVGLGSLALAELLVMLERAAARTGTGELQEAASCRRRCTSPSCSG